ncbi:MAG: efflux RND transporter periplasmic adaptor subunit [Methylococcales bacterium]
MKYTLPILAAAGFLFASYTVVNSNKPVPIAPALVEPASAPFQNFIAGAGIIEPKNENIAIGSPLARLVSKVVVKVGDKISTGTPLFYLDDRENQAELAMKKADLAKAKADVLVAKANVADTQSLFDLANAVSDSRAISGEEVLKRRNALAVAKAKLESANAFVEQAQAAILQTETTLDRLIVRAPIDGDVLQVNVRAGEFATAGALSKPLLILGDLKTLHVRVDIDENDAWRFDKNSKAVAYLRGNRQFKVDLQLAYVEPFVVPKKSLTGDSTERVDTRVLQALYQFNPKDLTAYVGQQMDVFIEVNGASGL